MGIETLRRAAALMRERAEAATPGPWRKWNDGHVGAPFHHIGGIVKPTPKSLREQHIPDAAHIASWHPVVALAVAHWLDAAADTYEPEGDDAREYTEFIDACNVARAYLGGDA